ncbi:Mth938-like domain-containing protein [Shimia ponticola]|uniref:Mth938-like domain-containing protein n=1 Tax=Shimia ponticola TaxID=2582893 RepID=UPI0011BE921C|nr:Mth938-like domain-containing protein [Shimia ponticola]
MQFNEVTSYSSPHVEGYGDGFFRVAGEVVQGPMLLLPSGATAWGGTDDLELILAAADDIDVLFLGTGPEIAYAPAPLRAALEDAGIGVEVMATPTACRTFNVLLGEGRRIGLAVLPV